jgi:hypothetical protein
MGIYFIIRNSYAISALFLLLSFLSGSSLAVEPICPGGATPRSDIIFCEDWDNGAPTGGWPNTLGASFNGWETGDYMGSEGYAELSTTIKHSGSRSYYQLKKANENAVKDQWRSFTPVAQMRMRFYVYFDSSYENLNSIRDKEDYQHFIFLQTALSGRGVRLDIFPSVNKAVCGDCTPIPDLSYPWPPTCTGGNFAIGSPSGYGETYKGVTYSREDLCFTVPQAQNLNRWILVEWAYKINSVNDGRVSLWIDGVERMRDELLPPDPTHMTIDCINLSGYMSVLQNYPVAFYIDDIVMTNNYDTLIGPRQPEQCAYQPVKISGTSNYFDDIQSAYNELSADSAILMQAHGFTATLIFDDDFAVTLKGGYDCNYSSNDSGHSTVTGSVAISKGTIIADKLIIN